jgi:hypothetical protein
VYKRQALTSTGMKREKAIWALCPELVAGALEGPAKAIKSLQLVFFAIPKGREVLWREQAITWNDELYSQIAANFTITLPTDEQLQLCQQHEIDRIVFIDNEWTPIGSLPKLEPIAAASEVTPNSPAALLSRWKAYAPEEVFARAYAHAFIPPSDPAIELIDDIPNPDKKEALTIAYNWATSRRDSETEITRADFLNRARA